MRYRAGSSKIKYKHGMIQGLRSFLENELELREEVKSIFPGEIKPTRGSSPGFRVRFKYATQTGVKLLAYTPSAVQEVFVITSDPEVLRSFVEQRFGQGEQCST